MFCAPLNALKPFSHYCHLPQRALQNTFIKKNHDFTSFCESINLWSNNAKLIKQQNRPYNNIITPLLLVSEEPSMAHAIKNALLFSIQQLTAFDVGIVFCHSAFYIFPISVFDFDVVSFQSLCRVRAASPATALSLCNPKIYCLTSQQEHV